jgi:hypothetical protein
MGLHGLFPVLFPGLCEKSAHMPAVLLARADILFPQRKGFYGSRFTLLYTLWNFMALQRNLVLVGKKNWVFLVAVCCCA